MEEIAAEIRASTQAELAQRGDELLARWCHIAENNGIKQHSPEWYIARGKALGGSSQGTLQGVNPYQTVYDMMLERAGVKPFQSAIAPQWGNMLEDVLAEFVNWDLKCKIRGDDLYVFGRPYTSYSPDGLALCDMTHVMQKCLTNGCGDAFEEDMPVPTGPHIVLMEFKCPFARVPKGECPIYYRPQVEMGLDLLGVATYGIFCEAVIRRCSWQQLTFDNPYHDKTLVKTTSHGTKPLACGMMGFYITSTQLQQPQAQALLARYIAEFTEYGMRSNDYISNDIGSCTPDLFKLIMAAYEQKIVTLEYFKLSFDPATHDHKSNADLAQFRSFCKKHDHACIGLMPFKILRADYHCIHPREGYLDKWQPVMQHVLSGVDEAKQLPMEERAAYLRKWCIANNFSTGDDEPEPDTNNPEYVSYANATGFDD